MSRSTPFFFRVLAHLEVALAGVVPQLQHIRQHGARLPGTSRPASTSMALRMESGAGVVAVVDEGEAASLQDLLAHGRGLVGGDGPHRVLGGDAQVPGHGHGGQGVAHVVLARRGDEHLDLLPAGAGAGEEGALVRLVEAGGPPVAAGAQGRR